MPLGEGGLGLFVGAALLPAEVPAFAAVTPAPLSGERGVSAPRSDTFTGGFTPPARLAEAFTGALGDAFASVATWDAPTDFFARPAQKDRGTLMPSPPREQAAEVQPSLALRASETRVSAHAFNPTPLVVVPAQADAALLTILAGRQPPAAPATDTATPTQEAAVQENFGQLPLSFEQNVGQTDAAVHFFTRGPGYGLFLTSTEAVMVLQQPSAISTQQSAFAEGHALPARSASEGFAPTAEEAQEPPAVVRMQLVGANATPALTGHDEQPGKVNYFLGNDSTKWHTNVSTFARVEYDEVYPGIDLVWYGSQQQLEYDFVVSPGADPNVIRLNVSGAERLEIDAAGDLLVHVGRAGSVSDRSPLRQHAPFVYQEMGGQRQEVASRFVLEGRQVRFEVGAYDAARPLVIDPVLSYSTYLGGSREDYGQGIALNPATGTAFVTGTTPSVDFPTMNPFQVELRGSNDIFITQVSADGSALIYSTYLGGGGSEDGGAIAVDPATGNAFVTGSTSSSDFPVVGAFQSNLAGTLDAFVLQLSATGAELVYSSFLGGNLSDAGLGIALAPNTRNAFVTGWTTSTDFPTVNPLQPGYGGLQDAFVARVTADGSALVYSTYLGGQRMESDGGIAVDPNTLNAFVTGSTFSTNFPTANPFQAASAGRGDAFVSRLTADGSALVYSTYLGGDDSEFGGGIAVNPDTGTAFVTGSTRSTNFPIANALQPANGGVADVFVAQLLGDGSGLVYSTYLGGTGLDTGDALAVDSHTGEVYLTGGTLSRDFPTVDPFQPVIGAGFDAFITRLSADGGNLIYSSFLGGNSADSAGSIAVGPNTGDAYLAGGTRSTDFPTTPNAFDTTCGTDGLCNYGIGPQSDGFVARIGSSPAAYYYVYPDSGQVTAGVPFDLYVFALDGQFRVIPDYAGLVLFWATDPQAVTPVYHQFQRTERGVAYFPGGLTFQTPGLQELYVFDWPAIQVFGYAAFDVRP